MGLIERILREASLTELRMERKPILDFGAEHNIYAAKFRDDVIIKVSKHSDLPTLKRYVDNWKKHPECVAEVIKATNKYLVIEKLDQAQVWEEVTIMNRAFNRTFPDNNFTMTTSKLFCMIVDLVCGTNYEDGVPHDFEDMVREALLSSSETITIYDRWTELFDKVKGTDLTEDLWPHNVGYDKKGKLKILDA